jgi:hypothetical protein
MRDNPARDEQLREERERRANVMRHFIAAGAREARRRGVDAVTVEQIAAEMRGMISTRSK